MPGPLDFGPFLLLGEDARASLLRLSQRASFPAGATVIREGDPPDDAYAIIAGRVRVVQGTPPLVVATPSAPVLIGETSVVTGEKRNASVIAITQVRAYRIPGDAIRAACVSEEVFGRELSAFAELRLSNNFLRRSSPFADLPAAAIEALAAKLTSVHFWAGDIMLREGERGDDAYLIRSGEVEIVRGDRVVTTSGPGSFIGEISALTGLPRTATVRAKSDVAAFRVSGADARPIVKKYSDLVSRLEHTMQSRHIPKRIGHPTVSVTPDDPNAHILRDGESGTYLRLNADALAVYEDIDGVRSLRDLAIRHFQRTGGMDPAGVFATVATLQAAGLVSAPRIASDEPDARLMRIADLVLAPRIEIKDADGLARALHHAVRFAFTRPGAAIAVALGVAGTIALFTVFHQASPTDFGLGGLIVALVGLLLAGVGHEAAHAIATKAEGRRVGRAGFGLLFFTPVIYVDTSDAWLVPRHRRVRVNAAGPLFNFAFAGLCGLVAFAARGIVQDLFVWLAVANLASVVFNLSPLLEFDGYYVVEDLANVNALRRKSLRFVFKDLVARPRLPQTRLERGFVIYAACAVLYVLVVATLVLLGVPALVTGIFEKRIPGLLVPVAGVAIAVVLVTLQVMPLVGEVREARAMADD